jgi:RAP1 GTPase activating protein 1
MALNLSGNTDFNLENTSLSAKITGVNESLLQDCEKDIIWYRDHFFGKEHINLLASETSVGPLAVSLILDGSTYKALVRSANVCTF